MRGLWTTSAVSGLLLLVTSGVTTDAANGGETRGRLYDNSIGDVVQAPKRSGPEARGYLVFYEWCAGCHAADYGSESANVPPPVRSALGTYELRRKYGDREPAALQQRTDLTGPLITAYVRRGAGLMPPFRKTEVSDSDLRDLVAYLTRNTRERKP